MRSLTQALRAITRGGAGHLILAFSVGWIFMYTDRAVFSPVLGVIGDEFSVSPARLGLLGSTFYLAYAAFQIPVGIAAQHFSRKRLLVVGFALFGISTALSGIASSFFILVALSLVTGLGQATYYPVQYSIAAEHIPPANRTLSIAIINAGMAVGVGGGTLFAAYVAFGLGLGWRLSLVIMGSLTLVVALWLAKVVGGVDRPAPRAAVRPWTSIRSVLHRPQVAAYIAGFCSLYGFFALLTWLPYYLDHFRGMGAFSAGAVSTVAAWSSIPAALIAAHVSDSRSTHRRILLGMFPVAALALAAIPYVDAAPAIGLLVVYGAFGKLATDPLLVAYLADRTPSADYPVVYATFNFSGMLGSVLAPAVTGMIVEFTDGMAIAFLVAAGLLLVGALSLWMIGSEARASSRGEDRSVPAAASN